MRNVYETRHQEFLRKEAVRKSNQRYFKKRGAPTFIFLCFGLSFLLQCSGLRQQQAPAEVTVKEVSAIQVSAIEL